MSFINCDWAKIARCPLEDRQEMISYIETLIELKREVERLGISGFDNYLNSNPCDFEKLAIWLVSEGYSPDLCASILLRVLNISYEDSKQYLKNAIFSEFVLILQKHGVSTPELRLRLFSYLGIEFMKSVLI